MTNLMTATLEELRNIYRETAEDEVDGRWGRETLITKIEFATEIKQKLEADEARAQAETAKREAERQNRIARRGTPEEFAEKLASDGDEGDAMLRWAVRSAIDVVERFPAKIEKFTSQMHENPVYALSWSKDIFGLTAEHQVAQELLAAFSEGVLWETWKEYCTREVLRRARSPGRSTSATSNLMDEFLTEAWASAANRF